MPDVVPPTEEVNPRSVDLDLLDTRELVETIVADQHTAVDAVLAQSETIARVVDDIADRLDSGGRLHYVGAGSSGRLGMLDAAEMPPTFGMPPELVRAHVAGGIDALVRAVEGAEDDAAAGIAVADDFVNDGDVVLGISASGSAAFVVTAIERAKEKGALTIALTSAADSAVARAAEMAVILETGAEVLAGSTRLKAGTAQKIALNAISTAVMVRLNKIYDNLMVDVVASNRKLRARAIRLIQRLADVDERRASDLLLMAQGRVKAAVVMERCGVGPKEAQSLLDCHDGSLRAVLE
jgi:N-acetylmuramic acid 6-phosphate etherase